MTPARRHRERMAALAASADPETVVSSVEGGQSNPATTVPAIRTPALMYRERTAAMMLVAAPETATSAEERIAAQIGLRLTHDLRRLKEIRSIDKKVEAKRDMLPEYADWIAGLIAADQGVGTGLAAEVAPTAMLWLIDTGDYAAALDIAEFLLRHNVTMPARYQRDVATIAVEEIADCAAKVQATGEAFPLDILIRVDDLTDSFDMHDQVRAKLMKAIGIEQLRDAEAMDATASRGPLETARAALAEAQRLHDRIGVKDRIKRADKLLKVITDASPQNEEQGGNSAA